MAWRMEIQLKEKVESEMQTWVAQGLYGLLRWVIGGFR